MKAHVRLVVVILASTLIVPGAVARAEEHRAGQSAGFEEDMRTLPPDSDYGAFIHFGSGERSDHDALLTSYDLTVGMWFPSIEAVYAAGTVSDFQALVREPLVTYLEDNQELGLFGDTAPWATRVRVAQTTASGGPFRDANGNIIDGRGVGIAVVDTGVDGTHPDLVGRMAKNFKVVCSTPIFESTATNQCFGPVIYQEVPDSDTSSGHGTHVAGIAAGDGTASQGTFTGVAPGAKIYGFSWFEGASVNNLQAAAAFQWVLTNGASQNPPVKIVTNSWGCVGGCPFAPMNIANRLADQLVDAGVTVLFAAGNDGGTGTSNELSGYAKNPKPGVIGVGAYFDNDTGTRSNTMYSGSSRALNSAGDVTNFPDLSAPGQFIVSTCTQSKPICQTGAWFEWSEHYANLTGTSMATPHVAGAAALLYQADPSITPAEVEEVMQDTVLKFAGGASAPGEYIADPQNTGGTTSFDKGAGLLDVPAALSDPRVGGVKEGVGRNGSPSLAITSPAAGADVGNPVTLTGTAADGTYSLSDPVSLATDPADYDGPGAADLRELSMADTPGALTVRIRVDDVDDRLPSGGLIRYITVYKIDGAQKNTSVDLTATGVVNPAQNTGLNTHRASTVALDPATDTISYTVSHATLGNPAANSLIHNIQVFVQAGAGVIVLQDTMPGGIADVDTRPQYASPFTINGSVDPAPAATVGVSLNGGPEVAAAVLGSGPYTWSLGMGALVPGSHSIAATLRLNGVPRATVTRSFNVVTGNAPPILSPIGNKTLSEMETLTIDVMATDSDDAAATLALTSSAPPPAGATFVGTGPGTGQFNWRPSSTQAAGSPYSVTFTVTDPAGGTDFETISITVTDAVPRAVGPGGLEYQTIQEAIDATVAGDTIYVLGGTHTESLTIDEAVTLCGSPDGATCIDDRADAGAVTLEPDGDDPIVTAQDSGVVLQGLTFDGFNVGVSAEAPSLTIRHSIFVQGNVGLAVGAVDGTLMRLNRCELETTVCVSNEGGRTVDARLNDWSVYVDALVARRMDPGTGTILFRPFLTS